MLEKQRPNTAVEKKGRKMAYSVYSPKHSRIDEKELESEIVKEVIRVGNHAKYHVLTEDSPKKKFNYDFEAM